MHLEPAIDVLVPIGGGDTHRQTASGHGSMPWPACQRLPVVDDGDGKMVPLNPLPRNWNQVQQLRAVENGESFCGDERCFPRRRR